MKKFVLAITLVMSMLMTGCGGAGQSSSGEATTEATGSEASESGATGDVSEATQKIIDKGVLKVGSSGDLYAYLDRTQESLLVLMQTSLRKQQRD